MLKSVTIDFTTILVLVREIRCPPAHSWSSAGAVANMEVHQLSTHAIAWLRLHKSGVLRDKVRGAVAFGSVESLVPAAAHRLPAWSQLPSLRHVAQRLLGIQSQEMWHAGLNCMQRLPADRYVRT